jgi:Na+/H+ antiporter NhaC
MSSGSEEHVQRPSRSVSLGFHGGTIGALAPFALFLVGVAWLGLSGAPDERGFWPVLLAALTLGLLLARDRGEYSNVLVEGMSQPIVMIMVMAWILAGVLGVLMNASGFIEALVWLAGQLGVMGRGYVAASFLICAVVSTATGTSLGTILLCSPLLYPAGGLLGANPVILIGAILGGATFGDNISPVSDTTIASSATQRADLGGVVRSRLKYALPAAALALAAYTLSGAADPGAVAVTSPGPTVNLVGTAGAGTAAGAGGATGTGTLEVGFGSGAESSASTSAAGLQGSPRGLQGSPRGLPMLLAPVLVLALLLSGRRLIEGLLLGILAAVVIGLALGSLLPSQLLFIDVENFRAAGLILDGMERGVGVSIFTILLMGLVAGLEASGILGRVVELARRRTHSPRGAELWIFGTMSAAVLLITHSAVAILTVGEFAHETGEAFGIHRYRRANILDITSCTYPFLLPFYIPTIVAASTTAGAAAFNMPRIAPLATGLFNFHSWALLAVLIFAIVSGFGRDASG